MDLNILIISCLVPLGLLVTFIVINLEQKREVKTLAETDIKSFERINLTLTAWKNGKYNAPITTKNNRG